MFSFVLKGLIVGLTVAIPVGPVGLLCLNTTVSRGRKAGLYGATGMVLADVFSSTLMLLGMSAFYQVVLEHSSLIKAITAALFAGIGLSILVFRKNHTQKTTPSDLAKLSIFFFILSVSPATFALMLYLYPALELNDMNYIVPINFGVAIGSIIWCTLILSSGAFIKRILGEKLIRFRTVVGVLFILIGVGGVLAALL
ncbi:MAG: LysE family transporter [Proteobacteria bacterium]|nr:LysE family transporter [Pseudomonadota bacterium]